MGLTRFPKEMKKQLELTYSYRGQAKDKKFKTPVTTRCLAGHAPHRSIFEASVCNSILADVHAGIYDRFEKEYKVDLIVAGKKIYRHYMDFACFRSDRLVRFLQAKGHETDVWKIIHKLVVALYPEIPYEVRHYDGRRQYFNERKSRHERA